MIKKFKLTKHKGIIPAVVIIVCAVLTILIITAAGATLGDRSGVEGNGSLLTENGGSAGCTDGKIDSATLAAINQNKSVYQQAAQAENIDWEMLAAVHYREGTNNPNSSLMSGETLGTKNPDNGKTYYTLLESAVAAAQSLKSRVSGLKVGSDSNTVELAFLGHNRGGMYKRGGCSIDQSPYVMNQYDEAHKNMVWPNSSCEPASTRGKTEKKLGAFTLYSILKGNISGSGNCGNTDGGAVPGGCTGVIENAKNYGNKGITYSMGSHCGPDSVGAKGVTQLDCSGYTSRVYHDAGLTSGKQTAWCTASGGISSNNQYVLITNNRDTAKQILKVGDLIVLHPGGGSAYGHVVIYGGSNGNGDIIYETVGSGVHAPAIYSKHYLDIPKYYGRMTGVFRAKTCKSTSTTLNKKIVTLDPGHPSEVGPGTNNPTTGITEVKVVYEIALKVKTILESKGYTVVMTKKSQNEKVTNQHRAEIANQSNSSLFVRLHTNDGGYKGSFVEYPDTTGTYKGKTGPPATILAPSKKAAELIAKTVKSATGLASQGARTEASTSTSNDSVKKAGVLVGSLYSQVPTSTIEMIGMHDSADNARWIADPANQQKMAQGIANGIIEYLSSN